MKKKVIGVFLALVIVLLSAAPAAAVSYPAGVDEQNAAQSAKNLDVLISRLIPMLGEEKDLGGMVEGLLFTDETLSGILTGIYGKMDDYSAALKILGIDVSTAALSAHLESFPEVSKAVGAASGWAELKLDGVSWGVKNRGGFARAVSLMLSPFNDVLYMLLCSGRVNVSVIPIFGDDGYLNGVVPMLNASGFFGTMSNDSFKAHAAEWKGYMFEDIVLMIFDLMDDVLASPVTELCSRLPNLAFFFKSGQFADAVDGLLHPISVHIGDIITLVPATKLISVLMFFSDTKKYTTNFTENMTTVLNDALESSDVELAEINLDELQSCGTERDGRIVANLGEAFVEIMSWLVDTLKLNKEKLADLLKENEIDVSDYQSVIDSLLAKPTDELLALIVKLMTAESGEEYDYQWARASFTPGSVEYTEELSEYEMNRTADGIDEMIGAFIAEAGEYKSLQEALKKNLYTDAVVSTACVKLYSFLGGEDLKDILGALGFDFSPSGVASHLKEWKYSSARRALQSAGSWDKVSAEKLSFGVRAGNANDFENALIAVLRPFEPLLAALLANRSLVILDSVHIPGSNGYNTAIIPILEALGCSKKDILSYREFEKKAGGDGVLEGVLDPIIKLINRLSKKPISGVINILPNVLRFIDDGSLMQCLINLLHPVLALLDEAGLKLEDMGLNLDELKGMDLLGMISGAVPGLTDKISLDSPDLKKLANLGTLEERISKATYLGENYAYDYETADRPAVMLTIMRYVMKQLEKEENSNLIADLMGSGEEGGGASPKEGGNMFNEYAGNFGEQFKGKSTDENIAFLYRLFFHERVTEETTTEPYEPTIIYEKEDKFELNVTALVTSVFILLLIGTLALVNRKRITYTVETMKKRRKEKKENGREAK